ncbi:hypothetical protein DW091_03340 [Eubacterium sp. AM05-23]|uniref:hypothetical protein n=1 Tax=Eubacterium TaxID=1730 RepID=UPI000E4D9A62|nr:MULTISPECIES: hypothetical protein [Eubacterium]RHO60516.1 hypothetical protein DW091_03340 [Eubacterium sp. AM05-23]
MQPQEKAVYQDMLQCIFARYLEDYSENTYSELLKKYTGLSVIETGEVREASYETVLRLLKQRTRRYTGLGCRAEGDAREENILYPAAFETQGADPEIARETDYGTAWDGFDNMLLELPEEKQVECKMALNSLESIVHDPSMTKPQKQLLSSILLDWIAREPEDVGILFVPMLLQIYE